MKADSPHALAPYRTPAVASDVPAEPPAPPVLIRNGTVMTAAGKVFAPGYVLLAEGRIAEVGPGEGAAPPGARVVDARGGYVTPGIIDTHSHLGVYAIPMVLAHSDGNETSAPNTAQVWAEHSFWPQDPSIWRALAGGVTTIQVLPGSTNLFGGRSFTAKLLPKTSARQMRFPGAPQGLKMACGENPKRYHGDDGGEIKTRMGNVAGYRAAFQKATEYRRTWAKYRRDLELWEQRQARKARGEGDGEADSDGEGSGKRDKPDDPPDPPTRDLSLETLVEVLDGKMLVHNHCYRVDEMHLMLDLAHEFGFKIRSFHHAVEAYKLADRLAQEGVASSIWADWWGFKLEAFDGIPQNAALLQRAGARVIIHSDSFVDIRRLNQEAAKARISGKKVGIEVSENDALRWITANPAWALGIDDKVGTLEKGKMADVVVWSGHPFSVYTLARQVFIDGRLAYDRTAKAPPISDFEVGIVDQEALP